VATAALSLLLALPLPWRRRAPFVAAGAVLLAIDLQALASGDSAEGLFYVVPIALAGYAIATYGTAASSSGWRSSCPHISSTARRTTTSAPGTRRT
jgi:hypothetical protein